ncbi:hypothetical protein [Brevibacillus panacihumi]|uniref:Uncharacterized protein n=1 Tax=Brevibacillus panacihumi TaxID=497735 RepID=A0A3M8C9F4_9BACL|nr:hypothetical protein [Brevibacillus panacihumi]RNB72161.1 hypothetical protein EDM58_21900 [Brevibacillus panacihumi]
MITIREYVEWKMGRKQSMELLEMIYQEAKRGIRSKKSSIREIKKKRPSERFSQEELRRMMGDVGPRRFLKDVASRRK